MRNLNLNFEQTKILNWLQKEEEEKNIPFQMNLYKKKCILMSLILNKFIQLRGTPVPF